MSTTKKPTLRKRKRQSPPPSTTSQISLRLEKLRSGQRNIWNDDDNSDDQNVEQHVQSKITTNNKTYIVLSDSDDEKISSRQRSKTNKSEKKSSRIHDENLSSDNDYQMISKCATCLICSILKTLTSYNCCSKHLSLLINNKNSYSNHQYQTSDMQEWSPQQVMIVPMTDELIQRYLNPQEMYRLRTRTSTSPIQKKPVQSKKSTRKLPKKSTITLEPSDNEHLNITKSKAKAKSSAKSSHMEPEQISSPSSISDSALPNSGTTLPDATYTVITSTSTTINSFESPNVLDTCQLQQSSDQPIIIDDSQSDNQQENLLIDNTQGNKQNDPWTPISDDTYRAIELALNQVDQNSQDQPEFTPAIARRTPTELMASRLPKIQLKKGRFHQGKPIDDKNPPDTTTTTTTTKESRSMTISHSSSTSASTSVITTNTRPPPSLATIIEDESLIIQTTRQTSDKSGHILSERQDTTTECLSDTVMSSLLAQDESSQHDNIHITTKTISNKASPLPAITIEDYSRKNEINKSIEASQSSQLTNDQSDTQPLISSTTSEKPTTPARVSYRRNPDGSRVSISRPPLTTNHRSLLTSLRRASTDVISITSQTNK